MATALISRSSLAARRRSKGDLAASCGNTGIDDPGPGFDARPPQVGLQACGLQYRRGFGQCDNQHLRLFRVLQLHHRRGVVQAGTAHLARHFAVISAGRIQQQQGVSGGRGIHHHELLAGFPDNAGKRLEHGDFLGTGRAQVFFQQRTALCIELCAFGL